MVTVRSQILIIFMLFVVVTGLQINLRTDNSKYAFKFMLTDLSKMKLVDLRENTTQYYTDSGMDNCMISWYEQNQLYLGDDFEKTLKLIIGSNNIWSNEVIIQMDRIYSLNYYYEYNSQNQYTINLVDNSKTFRGSGGIIFLNEILNSDKLNTRTEIMPKVINTNRQNNELNRTCCIFGNGSVPQKYQLCTECITFESSDPQECVPITICPSSDKDFAQFLLLGYYDIDDCNLCTANKN